jgi:hypothetical protein
MKDKGRVQQYLKPYEEEVIVKYLPQMSNLGYLIQMKFYPFTSPSVLLAIDLPLNGLSRLPVGNGQKL